MKKRTNLNSKIPNWRILFYLFLCIGGSAFTGYLVKESPLKFAAIGIGALLAGAIVIGLIAFLLQNKKTEKIITNAYLVLSYILGILTVLIVYQLIESSIKKSGF